MPWDEYLKLNHYNNYNEIYLTSLLDSSTNLKIYFPIKMDEKSSRHSKRKSSNHYKEETIRHKSRKSRYHEDSKQYIIESKTPPLPTKKYCSIEELLKKRESLKDELKKIVKCDSTSVNSNNKQNMSRENRKRKESEEYNTCTKNFKTCHDKMLMRSNPKNAQESSPEHNEEHAQVDSEDEESIIEQRRKQRKQLLEKLSTLTEKRNTDNELQSENFNNANANNKSKMNVVISYTEPMKKETDMFSDKDDFVHQNESGLVANNSLDNNSQLTDNWDDSEGYYTIRAGDIISNNRYTIKDTLGQGVFANVVRAQENDQGNSYVAIKIVRNNDLMYKTGLKEISVLKEINEADPDNKYHCIKLLGNFMHKGHLCLVLESLHMDLRCVLKKYGKNHGINMKALISYSRQLLLALRLLKKIGIIHADIKPDNILVNEKKNILKLCDFGSAAKVNDNEPTPYLVSRFYRAPEIILGVPYKHGVDIWSTACTIYEMATGKIMFTGSSNNKMLKCFMDLKGKIPSKIIRKGKFKDQHFNYNNNFLLHKKDEFTGRDKVVEMCNISVIRDLQHELKKSYKHASSGEEKKLGQLKDLLDKIVMFDSHQRLSIVDCLKHPFIQEEIEK